MENNSPWNYFNRILNKDIGVCRKCSKQIKAVGGSTSGLHSHLKSQHNINLLKRNEEIINDTTTSNDFGVCQTKMTAYFKKTVDESFAAVVARMIAKDGIPFVKFCTSQDLRMLLQTKGYISIPKSSKTIQKIVIEYADKIKQEVIKEITKHKLESKAFSLTLDEWTSIKNRRYMNINLHGMNNKFWNLGLCRIHGSMPAEKCANIIDIKLKEFDISLENIVSITTDGASVMKKTITIINTNHQLCLVHGIQLSVIEVLYNKNIVLEVMNTESETIESQDMDDCTSYEDDDFENIDHSLEVHRIITDDRLSMLQNIKLTSLITKIRKVVKLFRKSPTKNAVLQKHVREEFGKELSLILDSKTRWNSLLSMLERFSMIKDSVRKSIIDLKIEITFAGNELALLSDILLALQPIKLAIETLCSEKANLYTADVTLKFMLDELANQNTIISHDLKDALIHRLMERRNNYSDVLQYLFNPDFQDCDGENYGIFNKTSKSTIKQKIVDLIDRMNKPDSSEFNVIQCEFDPEKSLSSFLSTSTAIRAPTMKEKLQLLLKSKTETLSEERVSNHMQKKNLMQIIKKELDYFQHEKVKGKYIQMAFDYLITIRPTSVECERAFSSAGLFCTKIRSLLGDESLDKLCFLRAYFLNCD